MLRRGNDNNTLEKMSNVSVIGIRKVKLKLLNDLYSCSYESNSIGTLQYSTGRLIYYLLSGHHLKVLNH